MPPEDAEIAPDVEKHDTGGGGEKPQPEEEQTPEHGGVAERLEPEEVSEPVQPRDDRNECRDGKPQ